MFQKGLLQGSKAVCKVIYDKANDNKNNANEKIDEIKRFCEVSLNNKKMKERTSK